jgi:hypothetical protein
MSLNDESTSVDHWSIDRDCWVPGYITIWWKWLWTTWEIDQYNSQPRAPPAVLWQCTQELNSHDQWTSGLQMNTSMILFKVKSKRTYIIQYVWNIPQNKMSIILSMIRIFPYTVKQKEYKYTKLWYMYIISELHCNISYILYNVCSFGFWQWA